MLNRRIVPVATLAALLAAAAASGSIPSTERQVLLSLYASTGGNGWLHRTGWSGPAGTECSWYGIGCDASGSHVIEINLDANNLSGTLPAIAELGSLEYLILSNNRLTGSIPPVASLSNLRILELYANTLTGSIPSLSGLSSLTSLELNSNRLTGTIPDLSTLTSLQVFDLDTNDLTGSVPSLSAMTQLQYMALDTNRLSGVFPSLSGLAQLSDCELYDNQFTGNVPSLSGLSHLAILLLSNNRFSGSFPDVTGVPLRTLDLDYNGLSGVVPSSIGNATTLRQLLFAGNDLTGALPASLANLTNLDAGGSDFRYNGLFTSSTALAAFLNGKQAGGNWESTQTVAPTAVSAGSATNNAVRVAWSPIAYSTDPGSYGVYVATVSGGPYTLAVTTSDKTQSSSTVAGLVPSTTYFLVVRTTTDANPNNPNAVTSGDSTPVSISTTSCGACAPTPSALLVEGVSPYPPIASEPNGVLEPGETASLSPSWTDATPSGITAVTGSLSGLSGPDDGTAIYTLVDGSASYGSFAAGATRSCGTSCYQVRISADTRPAAHLDAAVDETLSTGSVHTWTLHLGDSFSDVLPSSVFYSFVETIYHHGITLGVAPATYAPSSTTARDQMAAFISRAHAGGDQHVPSSGTVAGLGTYSCVVGGHSLFSDVAPESPFCKNIHYIVARGLSYGCTDGPQFSSIYCPGPAITRRSMAVMLARDLAGGDSQVPSRAPDSGNGRSYDCTDGKANAFADVPDSDPGCKYVYFIWSKNVVDGFGNGTYGPDDAVARDQMAKYLTNTYRLRLYPID